MMQTISDYLRFGCQLMNGWRASHEQWIANLRNVDVAPFVNETKSLRVLDLANGRLRPQYKILRGSRLSRYWNRRRELSEAKLAGSRVRDCSSTLCRRIRANDLNSDETLVCGDVSSLPFRDQSFDVITSVAAFEHFLEVPKVLKEVHRIACPGALVWVLVHLFSSPSGGHNVSLSQIPLRNIPRGIDPWDHLRKRRLNFTCHSISGAENIIFQRSEKTLRY
jgi:SAM-dependent methyltransferase